MGTVADDVAHGQQLFDTGKAVVKGMPAVARGASNLASKALAPFGTLGKPLLRGAGRIGGAISNSPTAMKALVGTSILAPILAEAQSSSAGRETQNMLASSQFPERTVTANLKNHLIKTAGFGHMAAEQTGGLLGGIAKGFGGGLGELALGGAKMIGNSILDSQVAGPKREKVFYEALRTDSVLRDALRNDPTTLPKLREAFTTLTRFAPSLSMDINAVRSYLREAVISGGGINFATIKQLADTEKVIQDRSRGGK